MAPDPHAPLVDTYLRAVDDLLALAEEVVRAGDEDQPALGAWSRRDLLGHTGRSLTTVADYARAEIGPPALPDAVAYYRAASVGLDPADVEQRGRAAGEALGADPVAALGAEATRARAAVAALTAGSGFETPWGSMPVGEYLRTRIFELVVHGVDLARAIGSTRRPSEAPLRAALALSVDLAVAGGTGEDALLVMAGRDIPFGSVLSGGL